MFSLGNESFERVLYALEGCLEDLPGAVEAGKPLKLRST